MYYVSYRDFGVNYSSHLTRMHVHEFLLTVCVYMDIEILYLKADKQLTN